MGVEVDVSHGKGSHAKVMLNGKISHIPRHGNRGVPTGTICRICRRLGIDPKDL
ncbi:MAG: hypothetical protein HQL63_03415 [Magnetococcales bacterium]|nr:hypothetical protein [Magnetococcales bacterium]MBF0322198.1 hypothetical protein [Magnetococcales bacterium]